jgi:hypothetical protein
LQILEKKVPEDSILRNFFLGKSTAAVEAVQSGKTVIVVSPETHLWGLSSGGLGFTVTGDKSTIGGLSRERLEPYFKLHREANFNMIRNWTSESTEAVFYDLCDEYGRLVWNDFWLSTKGYNLNVNDNILFMAMRPT